MSRSLISLGGSWNQVGQDFVGNADGVYPDKCGISDDGNRIVVGTPLESTYYPHGGVSRVYDRAEDGWVQDGTDFLVDLARGGDGHPQFQVMVQSLR